MELVQTISQSQTMQMGGQLLQSLAILGMASNDLSEHIQERAEANPYVSYRPPAAFVARGGEDFDAVAAVAADRPSLMAHVVEQIERAFATPSERLIALHFAEALEPTGWLSQPVETIALVAGCPLRKAEQVLEVLQGFEPAGLFARSLSDCLLIQAREADLLTWEVETLIRNLDMLDGRRARLAELCDCEVSDIPDILGQIRGLNPKPGLAYDHVAVPVFPPDLIATRGEDGWTVELNRATTPTITVREDHASDDRADREARKLRRKALAEARSEAEGADDLEARLAAALAAQGDAESSTADLRDRLAAALAAQKAAEAEAGARLSEAERQAALLAAARAELSDTEGRAGEAEQRAGAAERQTELLNQQVSALRTQLSQLQGLLDDAKERDVDAQVQLQNLGSELNAALARVAAEERRRRQLEEAERQRLEDQAKDLERYRSEFFGRLREVIGNQEGIRIEGDRFVFSSEVLFAQGEAELSRSGQMEIAKIASILRNVMADIPEGLDWIIRVDGHTDDIPLRPGARFSDNWELSQARALSVVRYLVDFLGIPPDRLSANGFGQYQPIDPSDTAEARAQNRRIELKLTER